MKKRRQALAGALGVLMVLVLSGMTCSKKDSMEGEPDAVEEVEQQNEEIYTPPVEMEESTGEEDGA